MPNYLYNGVELPELPNGEYPYWFIQKYQYSEKYRLVNSEYPLYKTASGEYAFKFTSPSEYHSYEIEDDAWIHNAKTGGTDNYYYGDKPILWTNTDILNADGSVYLPASVPVIAGGKTSGTCLYNGVELPALPAWDKETYPYCTIFVEKGWAGTDTVCYFSDAPFAQIDENTKYLGSSMGDGSTAPNTNMMLYKLVEGAWEYVSTYSWSIFVLPVVTLIYTNYNLYVFQTDTLVLPASDPVPVGGEPALIASDFYKAVNRQWVKHSAVKPVGSEWVKQPQAGYETQGGQWLALS